MLSRVPLALLVLLALLVAGCGGGGGGGGNNPGPVANAALTVTLDATRRAGAGPDGKSVRLTLVDPNGTILDSRVNETLSGTRPVLFERLFPGVYTLRAELNSDPGFSGDLTGTLVTRVVVRDATAAAVIVVRGAATGVAVRPDPVTVAAGASASVTAALSLADGALTFSAPDAVFAYAAEGGIATISSSGVVSGVRSGAGAVRATLGALTGTAVLTVTDGSIPGRTPFTLLVYMNAANDRYPAALAAVNALERSVNGNFRVVIQLKQTQTLFPGASFDGTRRYLVRADSTDNVVSDLVQDLGTSVNMGAGDTLRDFVDWGRGRYPSDGYGVIVWGVGNGWSRTAGSSQTGPSTRDVSYDDEFGSAISLEAVRGALAGKNFRFLGFDASYMSSIETAFAVQTVAPTVFGTTTGIPNIGFPYAVSLRPLTQNAGTPGSAVGTSFVQTILAAHPGDSLAASSIDSSKINALRDRVETFARALISARDTGGGAAYFRAIADISPLDGRGARDLGVIATRIRDDAAAPATVRAAAGDVVTAVTAAVKTSGKTNAYADGYTGLSIETELADPVAYAATAFGRSSSWDEWILASRGFE